MILTRKDYQEIEHLEHLIKQERKALLMPLADDEVKYHSDALAYYTLEISKIYSYYS